MSYLMCTVCWGLHKTRCDGCHLTTADWKKVVGEAIISANAYWWHTWRKLKRFAQESTGDFETDYKCRRMFGPWLPETMDRQILYGILDKLYKGDRKIKIGFLTNESYLWLGTVLQTYNLEFKFEENYVNFVQMPTVQDREGEATQQLLQELPNFFPREG